MMHTILRPRDFLLGIIIGFIICCIAGHIVSKTARFHHFKRFFTAISPQMQYFPTAHEILVTAKYEASHDKILVLIGGSSIFRGVGQNPDELWTDELQKILGNQYKVLNFAIDGANLTSFGGVAYRILYEHYPKIIFVSTCFPENPSIMDGIEPYTYLFWDAYYKNLLHPNATELKLIRKMRKNEMELAKGVELHIMSYLDSYLYFRNLWNWVAYRFIYTSWRDHAHSHPFRSIRTYKDPKINNLEQEIERIAKDQTIFNKNIEFLSTIITSSIDLSREKPSLHPGVMRSISDGIEEAFASRYRANMLCVFPDINPAYVAAFSPKMKIANKLMLDQLQRVPIKIGCHAIVIGGSYYSPKDYCDARHLAASGGKKLAVQVAIEVRKMV